MFNIIIIIIMHRRATNMTVTQSLFWWYEGVARVLCNNWLYTHDIFYVRKLEWYDNHENRQCTSVTDHGVLDSASI